MRIFLILTAALMLGACSSDAPSPDAETTELRLYESARSSIRSGNYSDGVTKLQLLESRFPFGRFAQQAQLEIVYAYYRSGQPEAARAAADRFIRLHPQHPNIDYAFFLKK